MTSAESWVPKETLPTVDAMYTGPAAEYIQDVLDWIEPLLGLEDSLYNSGMGTAWVNFGGTVYLNFKGDQYVYIDLDGFHVVDRGSFELLYQRNEV